MYMNEFLRKVVTMSSVPLDRVVFGSLDMIVAAHDVFENEALYRDLNLVVDTRNIVAPMLGEHSPRVKA
jgi:hypothetical protein